MKLEVRNANEPRELLGWLPAPTGVQPGMRRTFQLDAPRDPVSQTSAFVELPIFSLKDSSTSPVASVGHWLAYATDVPRDTLKRIDGFEPAEGFHLGD